jgi:cytochrome c-type biogenesis protein CcsB
MLRLLSPLRLLPLLALLLSTIPSARASEPQSWIDEIGAIPVQDGGRVMPLEGYARRLAAQITGRQQWSGGRGPEMYSGRSPVQLFCDLSFTGDGVIRKPLIGLENKPFKQKVGLDAEQKFFSAAEIGSCKGINDLLRAHDAARDRDPQASPNRDERRAIELFEAANRIAGMASGESIAMVPTGPGKPFLKVGLAETASGTEPVQSALKAFAQAYAASASSGSTAELNAAAGELRRAIDAVGRLEPAEARSVGLELFYDRHNPWRKTAVFYGLSIVIFGLSRLMLRKPLVLAALACAAIGVVEHFLGIGLRVAILNRAPVSNTFEALLWMGLVAIGVGLVAQLINRRSYYLFGALCAALISVLFAGMVPLVDRTNSLPAVLRSNYWLTIHVLTIVASYGVLAVASVLGHVYLAREVLFAKRGSSAPERVSRLSHPLIAQTYRTIQIGLLLLTAGTILGGVWAADSWGRFWGWDPKETWALISIVVYFAVLHARYVRWLKDFGLAASAVLGFVVIVWTFYGVNYVMATGLHSYGFGSGGEVWVGLWAVIEIGFLIACKIRYHSLASPRAAAAPAQDKIPTSATPRVSGT